MPARMNGHRRLARQIKSLSKRREHVAGLEHNDVAIPESRPSRSQTATFQNLIALESPVVVKIPGSVVVVFELMAYGQDHNLGGIPDLVQRNVASAPKGDQQLPKEWAVTGLSVNERRAAQASFDGVPNHVNRQLRRVEVLYGLGAIEKEVE